MLVSVRKNSMAPPAGRTAFTLRSVRNFLTFLLFSSFRLFLFTRFTRYYADNHASACPGTRNRRMSGIAKKVRYLISVNPLTPFFTAYNSPLYF